MNFICKIFGHNITALNGQVFCIRCGTELNIIQHPNLYTLKRNIFGKVEQAQIIKTKDEIEELLNDETK